MRSDKGILPTLSVCATSYNSAQFLREHLDSVYDALSDYAFEYILVDNCSRDGTRSILEKESESRANLRFVIRRCSRGAGRQLAALISTGSTFVALDTDTIYTSILTSLVDVFLRQFEPAGLALQAIYAGLYPRSVWFEAGGMRNLNFADDLDFWMRIAQLGKMRWTPVIVGENLKPPNEMNSADVFSARYGKTERVLRLLRREFDLWRVRNVIRMDPEAVRRKNTVDLQLGSLYPRWIASGSVWSVRASARRFRSDLVRILSQRT